jgi:hypothetical protein
MASRTSSPVTAAIFSPARFRERATSATFSAAATGLAAPMLVMILMSLSRHDRSTARIRSSRSGS